MEEDLLYYLIKGNERVDKKTGEILMTKPKKLRHPLPTNSDVVDSNDSLRDYSLQRGVKGNCNHHLSLAMLDETLSGFKDSLSESIKVLKLIKKVKYMNRVFLNKNELLALFDKSSSNLNKHLNKLVDTGILKYEWTTTSSQYMITINPSIFFKGDFHLRSLYEEVWLRVNIESPLVSDKTIQDTLEIVRGVSVEEANGFYKESLENSKFMSQQVSVPRQVFTCSDIDFAIKTRTNKAHLPKSPFLEDENRCNALNT